MNIKSQSVSNVADSTVKVGEDISENITINVNLGQPKGEPRGAAVNAANLEAGPDPKSVFVIHGRNLAARNAVEKFLWSLGLRTIDFDVLAGKCGAEFVGEIVRQGVLSAQGIVALFTSDELASLRPEYQCGDDGEEDLRRWQARPNVIFEAGMAYGCAPERTILAVMGGQTRLFSDLKGVHLALLSNSPAARKRLRDKLIGAKCEVDQQSVAWQDPQRSGDFESCVLPGDCVK
jgi:predicted nucleotide-binding protein